MRRAALLQVFLLTLIATTAQDTIRVNTRLVHLDVIVRDKAGPVVNLSKDALTLLDNGKPQRIDVPARSVFL